MAQPRQEFAIGDARRLPGGVSIVGYRADGLPEGVHLGVPTAALTFILSLDGPVVVAAGEDDLRSGRSGSFDTMLAGLHETATHVEQPSCQEGIQLAIDPLAARALFGMPAAELAVPAGQARVAVEIGGWGRDLWQRVGETRSWQARFDAVAEEFTRRAGRRGAQPRREVVAAWRLLARDRGAVAIDDVARQAGLSGRQLREEFRREFGVGPKGAARLMRFEHAMARMTAAVRSARTPSLAGIAADCGYADQSHLAREFRGYLGIPPSAWLAAERRNIQVGGHSHRPEWAT